MPFVDKIPQQHVRPLAAVWLAAASTFGTTGAEYAASLGEES